MGLELGKGLELGVMGWRVLRMNCAILIRKFCFRISLLYLATGLKVSSVVNLCRDLW